MFGGGKGMGGGAGGGMLRTVSRAVARASVTGGNLQEPLSSSSTVANTSPTSSSAASRNTQKPTSPPASHLSISSSGSPGASHNLPISVSSGVPTWGAFGTASVPSGCDDYEWVSVDGSEDDYVLGPVPSVDEVHKAVSAMQKVFDATSPSQLVKDKFGYNLSKDVADQSSSPTGMGGRVSSVVSELDWMEPVPHLCNSRMFQPHAHERVYDAFRLLQTEPSVQKMVISLSSDKAVWDAVLNNEVVRELRESYYAVENNDSESSDETSDESNSATNFVKWIFDSTKAKVMEVIEKITKVANQLFKPADDEKKTGGTADPFQEKLRTSFLLSIVVLLVVVVTRANRT